MSQFFVVDHSLAGFLAIMPKPEPDAELGCAVQKLADQGVTRLVSLLEIEEANALGLKHEASECERAGLEFGQHAIADYQTPDQLPQFIEFLHWIYNGLLSGDNTVVHCRGGIGRSGLVAICLLLMQEKNFDDAVQLVQKARGKAVPETERQRLWIIDTFLPSVAQ